ncbi:MAG: cytochrome c [Myxococcota bacterium]
MWALGCGGDEASRPPEPPRNAAPVPEPSPSSPPEASVPSGSLRGDAARGSDVYALYCSACHGKGGKGDGPMSASLVPRPADHTNAEYMGSLSDEHLFKVVQQGGVAVGKSPLMTPWGSVLSEDDLRNVVAHLRALSGT